jgi:branched-chain amino acid transport system ATP-binding protein
MEALRIENLDLSYGGLEVLKGLSLTVEERERVAIIGPNGAGKTTLLNVLDGTLRATAGRVYLFGKEITNKPIHSRTHLGLGRSFQITQLFPKLTLFHNMLLAVYGIKPSRYQMYRPTTGSDEILAETRRLLEVINLWEKREEPMEAVSYGEQRRMEFILSLASKPKLLMMDEPSAGLSVDEVPALIDTIKTLARDTTLIFAEHDMDVVFGLAKRVVVLYFGQIIADGTPEKIQADPSVQEIYLGIEEGKANDAKVG